MTDAPAELQEDVWSRWLLRHRSGGDAAFDQVIRSEVQGYIDRLLDEARLGAGMTLVDIGAGEGAVAFRAIERVGSSLRVILTDISLPLLGLAKANAERLGVQNQCTFMACSADQLTAIAAESVDVVASRAALAYVPDKVTALQEFKRVLKPGGRISFAEPVFQDEAFEACVLRSLVETERSQGRDSLRPLLHRWKAAMFPDTPEAVSANFLTNFSERSLFELVRTSGFSPIHLELHIDLGPAPVSSWQVFLDSSPHPLAPTLGTILTQQFDARERQIFEAALRPLVESGRATTLGRIAYLSATKLSGERSAPAFTESLRQFL